MTRIAPHFGIFIALGLLFSCSAELVGSSTQAIIGFDGEDTSSPYLYPAVVSVRGSCTGTLISPNHVLTAAHCVQSRWSGSVRFDGDLSTSTGNSIRIAGCTMLPEYTYANRSCIPEGLLEGRSEEDAANALGSRCGVLREARACSGGNSASLDVAILQLERPVPHATATVAGTAGSVYVSPLAVYSGDDSMSYPSTAVGYGITSVAVGAPSDGGIRRYASVGNKTPQSSIFESGAPLASGDSGGPLVAIVGGEEQVIGVASEGSGRGGFMADSVWTGFGNNTLVRQWVDDMMDRNGDGRYDTACSSGAVRGAEIGLSEADDTDGDGYANKVDTCPNVYNPCQVAGDSDFDGIPDDCDACAFDPNVTSTLGSGGSDGDGDGVPDSCDCEPTVAETLAADDDDGDRITNACDNCVNESNTDQDDTDTDGRGDACDVCPFDSEMFPSSDRDGDGTPDACDNCEFLANPSQLNCNLDAEREVSAPLVGDACDPIPCAETELVGSFDTTSNFYEVDRLLVDGRLPPGAEDDYATGFRICPCEQATAGDTIDSRNGCRLETTTSAGLRSGGCMPAQTSPYSNPVEQHPWRWALVHDVSDVAPELSTSFGGPDELVLPYAPPPGPGDAPTFDLATFWRLDSEIPRWQAIAQQEEDDSVPMLLRRFPNEESEPALRQGVFWSHTPRDAGGGDLSMSERQLASHYWSGEMPEPLAFQPAPQHPCLLHIGPYIGASGCPLCGSFPAPYFSLGGDIFNNCGGLDVPPVLAIPDLAVDLVDLLGIDPREAFLQPDLEWLTPAEPADRLAPGTVRLVSRRVDGSGIEHAYVSAPGGLVEQWTPAPGPCSPASNCKGADLGRFDGQSAWATRSVLSATRAQVFSYGGWSDGQQYAGTLSMRSLTGVAPHGASPNALTKGVAVAMTYRIEDESLYVLLRNDVDGAMHLARIAADFTSDEIVASYALGDHDTFGLAVDSYGALWVAASKVGGGGHRVCRFTQDASSWKAQGWQDGAGVLANVAMTAGRIGLSLVVRTGGLERLAGHEAAELAPLHEGNAYGCF